MMLCVDLILMIKHPFKMKEPRMKFYIAFSVTVSLSVAILFLSTQNIKNSFQFVVFVVSFLGFLIAAIWSSIFSWKRLTLPGMSAEVRSLILKRHVASIAVYFICNLYVLVSSCYNIASYTFPGIDTWWAKLLKLLFCSQGYIMPALRCIEPAFLSVIKRQIRDLRGFITCESCRRRKLTAAEIVMIEEAEDMIYIARQNRPAGESVY